MNALFQVYKIGEQTVGEQTDRQIDRKTTRQANGCKDKQTSRQKDR